MGRDVRTSEAKTREVKAREVKAKDGRTLAVETWGDPKGRPVFLMHGTPGSRIGPAPRIPVLYRLGIRLITYDRPGYGGSTRMRKRQVRDAAEDVTAIADDLGLGRFAVVGRSGGGPHALSCAALLPERVTRVASMVSLAPWDSPGLDWFDGMAASNVLAYENARGEGYEQFVKEHLRSRREPVAGVSGDPGHLIEELNQEWTDSDREIVSDAGIRQQLRRTYTEALQGDTKAGGWVDDVLALTGDWGFRPQDIPAAVKVLLWHGEDDVFSPAAHTRWLGQRIDGATVWIEPHLSHFHALRRTPQLLSWAASAT